MVWSGDGTGKHSTLGGLRVWVTVRQRPAVLAEGVGWIGYFLFSILSDSYLFGRQFNMISVLLTRQLTSNQKDVEFKLPGKFAHPSRKKITVLHTERLCKYIVMHSEYMYLENFYVHESQTIG